MCRDEDFFLPIWHRYYASQFGAENLFIIDHNSQNASARDVLPEAINVISIPFDTPIADKDGQNRKSFDEERWPAISEFAGSLLKYYDCVIYNDTDEIYVADHANGLAAYLDSVPEIGTRAGIGIEVYHDIENEPPLKTALPIFEQRSHFAYKWHISRPCIMSEAVDLLGNGARAPIFLDPKLMMLHLRFADHEHLEQRQNLRLEAFDQNRGGQKSRWRLSMLKTLKWVRHFWEKPESGDEFPHVDVIKENLADYETIALEASAYPKFIEHGIKEVRVKTFLHPDIIKSSEALRYRFPERCKGWQS
jgi:hypothetical protein